MSEAIEQCRGKNERTVLARQFGYGVEISFVHFFCTKWDLFMISQTEVRDPT